MNNLALFVTHNLFLTKEQIENIVSGQPVETTGISVPVWVNAKTGKTTEPATEIFCAYLLHNSKEKDRQIDIIPKKGYEIYLPRCESWNPPPDINFEELATFSESERQLFLIERDKWWFNNPKPPSVEDLKNGYLRFEIKKTKQKIQKKEYSEQHIIEIAEWKRLEDSLVN
jgi:hypothetical protein